MNTLSDQEAVDLLPAVNEFVAAVAERDQVVVWACFQHTDPRTLAILCADLLENTRNRAPADTELWGAYQKMRARAVKAEAALAEHRRGLMAHAQSVPPKSAARAPRRRTP